MVFWISLGLSRGRCNGTGSICFIFATLGRVARLGRAPDLLTVKYDPRDMSRVFVRRMTGRWIEARYRDLRRPVISLWEYREAMRQLRDRGKREVNEAVIFETIAHQREIVLKARHDRASARLAHARQPRSAPPRPEPESRLTGIDLRKK